DTRAHILFESGRQVDGLRDMYEAVTEAPSAARRLNYATMLRRAGPGAPAERRGAGSARPAPLAGRRNDLAHRTFTLVPAEPHNRGVLQPESPCPPPAARRRSRSNVP